jgi:hypothetical protein
VTSPADITILVRNQNDRLILELSTKEGSRLPPVQLLLTPARLKELREAYAFGLRKFVAILATSGRVAKDRNIADTALRCLYSVGAELGFGIFGSMGVLDVQDFFRMAWPAWGKAADDDYVPPRVELVGSLDFPLPLEFVPLFSTEELLPSTSLENIACRFPVFSTIFFRSASDISPQTAEVIDNRMALLVRLFLHADLKGAKQEFDFLKSARGATLRGPWPDRAMPPNDFIRSLADQMQFATAANDTVTGTDHIQHFVCHCDTEKAHSRDFTIELAHSAKRWPFSASPARTASLAELSAIFFGRKTSNVGPLVFLNACGSSKITPEGLLSFPSLFLRIGSRGVIGTETAIPDLAAAEFAREFYTLFFKGLTLGEALFEARMRLLRTRFNPIGALYSAYANADLRIREAGGAT